MTEKFDAMHADGIYNKTYGARSAAEESWVFGTQLINVDLAIMTFQLDPARHRVLDLASGIGDAVRAWQFRGFRCDGVEISPSAVGRAQVPLIVGDATDLSFIPADSYDLVFSNQFFEHLTDEQIAKVLRQQARIAKMGAHLLAHEVGNDPTHINIKTVNDWCKMFTEKTELLGWSSLAVGSVFSPYAPLYVQFRADRVPMPVEHLQVVRRVWG